MQLLTCDCSHSQMKRRVDCGFFGALPTCPTLASPPGDKTHSHWSGTAQQHKLPVGLGTQGVRGTLLCGSSSLIMAAQCQESLPALRRGCHVDSVARATGRSWEEWFLWCSVSTLL